MAELAEPGEKTTRSKAESNGRKVTNRRPATLDDLKKKKKARRDEVVIPMDDGVVVIEIRAIGTTTYDDLVSEHPPTPKQRATNPQAVFNNDTFPCALIAACTVSPHMTYDDVEEIKTSEDWAGGEFQDLFMSCVRICQAGFDVPFNAGG